MSIQITITAESAAEAKQLVQDLACTMVGMRPEEIPAKTEVSTIEPKKEKPVKRGTKKHEPEPIEEYREDDFSDEPIPTVVELRAKAQEIGKTPEGKKSIKELLNQFGSKSISDVTEDKRAAFLRALEALAE